MCRSPSKPLPTLAVRISGLVQGVGFRPYVFRLATRMGLRGTVANGPAGVEIIVQGRQAQEFCKQLRSNPPRLAAISRFQIRRCSAPRYRNFEISPSRPATGLSGPANGRLDVPPDMAPCLACRRDLTRDGGRRRGYPFTNCTQCGPRYTIIERLPYDRPNTTMAGFRLCPACHREYTDPANRRFHAQPNACPICGPKVRLLNRSGQPVRSKDPIAAAARALLAGKCVAVLGLGGFQLACNATDTAAVARLRQRKSRPAKPLALMVADLRAARRFCRVSRAGRELLCSAAAPIVLLPKLTAPHVQLAARVAPDTNRLGVMLPGTPLHLLIFARLQELAPGRVPALVMTSANHRDEPIIAEEPELLRKLGGVFDLVLTHDRSVANRCDDSVVLEGSPPVTVRRARGYAPAPLALAPPFHVKHPTLALGAEARNCFCLAAANRAWLSPHLGGLGSASAEQFLRDTLNRFLDWFGVRPSRVACDLHPDYASTRLAEQLGRELGVPVLRVQHHHAHALAALAATVGPRPTRKAPALALCFDGTGYGTDGAIWGCEFLLVRPDLSWSRVGRLGYLRLADVGAELADPAGVAEAYLRQCRGEHVPSGSGPLSSSLGRLFDAVAAIAGVKRQASYEGEAAVALEAVAVNRSRRYPFPITRDPDGQLVLDPRPALLSSAADARAGVPGGVIAGRFQNGFLQAAVSAARRVAVSHRVSRVVLTGGCFQNRRLLDGMTHGLARAGLLVAAPSPLPVNDGGLSLGQAIAAGSASGWAGSSD